MAQAVLGSLGKEPVTINLTGGEPLLLPDLIDLMEYLHGFSNLSEVSVITNGTVSDSGLLSRLGRFQKFAMFKISVESGDEVVNDSIRGPQSLETLRRNIPIYRELTRRPVTLMITLSKLNFGTIIKTVEFARSCGVQGIIFERFVPLGAGKGMADAVLTADEWYKANRLIAAAAGFEVDPDSIASCRAFWLWLDREGPESLDVALCNLGRGSMALMPDGTVFPCRRLALPVGNVLSEAFHAIRERLAEWDAARVRPRLRGTVCGACPFEDCPGCRALSRALSGDPLGDDPQCVLQRDEENP